MQARRVVISLVVVIIASSLIYLSIVSRAAVKKDPVDINETALARHHNSSTRSNIDIADRSNHYASGVKVLSSGKFLDNNSNTTPTAIRSSDIKSASSNNILLVKSFRDHFKSIASATAGNDTEDSKSAPRSNRSRQFHIPSRYVSATIDLPQRPSYSTTKQSGISPSTTATSSSNVRTHISDDKRLLHYALKAVSSFDQLVFFNGHRVKALFDSSNRSPHIRLSSQRTWLEVANLVNQTQVLTPQNKAVHVHNELKLGDLLFLIHQDYRAVKQTYSGQGGVDMGNNDISHGENDKSTKQQQKWKWPSPEAPIDTSKDMWHRTMDRGQLPIVMTNTADENWGFLSTRKSHTALIIAIIMYTLHPQPALLY